VRRTHLLAVVRALLPAMRQNRCPPPADSARCGAPPTCADVRARPRRKRALEIAAAGGHSLLMVGPPGSGKSMLAQRLPACCRRWTEDEALASAALPAWRAGFDPARWGSARCAPHHTASAVALVGGGSPPRPGEISLAHHGVLFLDELPEFPRAALEALREPLETGRITIARAARRRSFRRASSWWRR
jgi:magnesium chelatase family protein